MNRPAASLRSRAGWSWIATVACASFVLGALVFGENYPFSRFSMYAASGPRSEGAVPVFWANDLIVEPEAYDRFTGIDPAALDSAGIPCTLEYKLHDGRRWIEDHLAAAGSPAGPVRFAAGFVILRIQADGTISRRRLVLSEGNAWPR